MSFFFWYFIFERIVGPRTAARMFLLMILIVIGLFGMLIYSAGASPRY